MTAIVLLKLQHPDGSSILRLLLFGGNILESNHIVAVSSRISTPSPWTRKIWRLNLREVDGFLLSWKKCWIYTIQRRTDVVTDGETGWQCIRLRVNAAFAVGKPLLSWLVRRSVYGRCGKHSCNQHKFASRSVPDPFVNEIMLTSLGVEYLCSSGINKKKSKFEAHLILECL